MNKQRGFTLIEAIVVVAITAILAAIAIPSFNESIAKRRLEGIADELHSDLQYAKTQSVSKNTDIFFETTAHSYQIRSKDSSGNTKEVFKSVILDSKTTLTSNIALQFITARMLPDAPKNINITQQQTSAELRLTIDTMGTIKTCSPNGSFGGYTVCP